MEQSIRSRQSQQSWIAIRKAIRSIAWILAAAIIYLSLVPPALRPETDLPHDFEHFGIFCVTGLAFGLGYQYRRALLAALLVCFAGAVEVAQLFAPGRHARLSDFIIDALAASVGVIVVRLVEWISAGG